MERPAGGSGGVSGRDLCIRRGDPFKPRHSFFYWSGRGRGNRIEQEPVDRGKEERLSGYAESFQGLSQIFMNMSKKKEQYTAEELGQMQNELTGRLCANCDCCAICWEQESTPLYGILSNMITSILNVGSRQKKVRRN